MNPESVSPTAIWFWWGLSMACVLWYCTITVYVAFKGVFDIRGMLKRLAGGHEEQELGQKTAD